MSDTKEFEQGDVLRGTKRRRDEAYHPIIYLSEYDGTFFLGGMITHSPNNGNIPLKEEHFQSKDGIDGKPQFFVNQFLLKKQEWAPFTKIGKLSQKGIKHVLSYIEKTEPLYWDDYLTL